VHQKFIFEYVTADKRVNGVARVSILKMILSKHKQFRVQWLLGRKAALQVCMWTIRTLRETIASIISLDAYAETVLANNSWV